MYISDTDHPVVCSYFLRTFIIARRHDVQRAGRETTAKEIRTCTSAHMPQMLVSGLLLCWQTRADTTNQACDNRSNYNRTQHNPPHDSNQSRHEHRPPSSKRGQSASNNVMPSSTSTEGAAPGSKCASRSSSSFLARLASAKPSDLFKLNPCVAMASPPPKPA